MASVKRLETHGGRSFDATRSGYSHRRRIDPIRNQERGIRNRLVNPEARRLRWIARAASSMVCAPGAERSFPTLSGTLGCYNSGGLAGPDSKVKYPNDIRHNRSVHWC
jgi:hypothetical protein